MDSIEAVRLFNRFFTRHVGAIDARFLGTDTNLPEARVLFEIARLEPVLASTLQADLSLDRGYLSRIVAKFEERGWITRERMDSDARSLLIRLTTTGHQAFDEINDRQRDAVAQDLNRISPVEQYDLVQALTKARLILDPHAPDTFTIRPAKTGETSQVVTRQSIIYADSNGWGRDLEVLEAETVAAFMRNFKPDREQCWVADLGTVMAGAVFLTDEANGVARIRLLHVEPFARRRGIGETLVRTCINFAKEKGYTKLVLWTHTELKPARRIYARNGFKCVSTEMHEKFGPPVQGELWELELESDVPVLKV